MFVILNGVKNLLSSKNLSVLSFETLTKIATFEILRLNLRMTFI